MGQCFIASVEDVIALRLARGRALRRMQKSGGMLRGPLGDMTSEKVLCCDDVANMADIEGIDFDIINKDILAYYHDCED